MSLKQNGKDHHTDNLKVKKKKINQSVCLLSVCLSSCVCLLILCVSVPRQQIKNRSVFLHVSSSTLWVFESDAASCLPSERNKDHEIKPNTFSVGGHGINYWTISHKQIKTRWVIRARLTRQIFSYKIFQTLWQWWF